MKIISKHKDFYDYNWIDNDPDLVYVRKEKLCFSKPDINVSYGKKWGEGFEKAYWSDKPGYTTAIGYTFGIYPFIYTVPALQISKNAYDQVLCLLSKSDMNCLETLHKRKEKTEDFLLDIYMWALKDSSEKPTMTLGYMLSTYTFHELSQFYWKEENTDFFFEIESPVFVTYATELLGNDYRYLQQVKFDDEHRENIQICKNLPVYVKHSFGKNTYVPQLVTNVCFNRLEHKVHRFWLDEMLDVYSDIENYLMSSKLEPEPKLSNNDKIISHGFDLKTSFRKM